MFFVAVLATGIMSRVSVHAFNVFFIFSLDVVPAFVRKGNKSNRLDSNEQNLNTKDKSAKV